MFAVTAATITLAARATSIRGKMEMIRSAQIQHITSQRLRDFQALTGRATVEEYFDEYDGKYPDPNEIYLRLCQDLDLDPLQ